MVKLSFWDWLAYVAFGFVIAYFLLKVLGMIESPIQLDIAAVISASYFVGRYTMKTEFIFNEVKQIKRYCKYCNQ